MARHDADPLYIPDERIAYWREQFPGTFEAEGTRALFAMRALAKRLDASSSSWLAKFGLTSAKYNYLVVLYVAPQGLMMNELSRRIHTSNASVTGMLAALEADGLVKRTINVRDRRSSVVTLTAAGRRLLKAAFPVHHRYLETALHDIPVRERQQLLETVLKIGKGLDRVAETSDE
jgi:DNA-binding MarR family transcriptional regulator